MVIGFSSKGTGKGKNIAVFAKGKGKDRRAELLKGKGMPVRKGETTAAAERGLL